MGRAKVSLLHRTRQTGSRRKSHSPSSGLRGQAGSQLPLPVRADENTRVHQKSCQLSRKDRHNKTGTKTGGLGAETKKQGSRIGDTFRPNPRLPYISQRNLSADASCSLNSDPTFINAELTTTAVAIQAAEKLRRP